MTDKELRKLSRLEILEILLEESKENEKLRTELEELNNQERKYENGSGFSEAAEKMNSALLKADSLVHELERIMHSDGSPKPQQTPAAVKVVPAATTQPTEPKIEAQAFDEDAKNAIISDRNLYWRLMQYYSQNEMALAFLPPDIQNDVRIRLRGILNAGK